MKRPAARPGVVYLVGAGPGDSGLVTRRALELVQSADVLYIDRLIPHDLIDEAREDAQRIDVGKTAGNHAMPQDEINQQIVAAAQAGRSVVRVKGGDPYLFGRGGEEALACRAAGVPFEVVPAVTSAFAACAAAGIPVTHRDISRNVTVVTASAGRDGQGDPDYRWLAGSDGTLVLLMGLRRVGHVAEQLIAHGMDPLRPAAVVSHGTTSAQHTVTATLSTLEGAVTRARVTSPAIIVIGEVVELREHLCWFEQRPLFGTRIAVTRARAQASELVARLTDLGADVVEVPAIRIEQLDTAPLDALIDRLSVLDVLIFTSRNGAEVFFERLTELGLDARALGGTRIGVVGQATAAACRPYGIVPDVMPPVGERTSMGLLSALGQQPVFGTSCGVVRADVGDDRFIDGLEQLGMTVELVRAYRTVVEPATRAQVMGLVEADVVTFTSASTVQHTMAMLPAGAAIAAAVSIGPTTTAAAQQAGIHVLHQAADATIDSLVAALLACSDANLDVSPWRHAPASPVRQR